VPRSRASKKGHAGDVLSTKEAAIICKVALSTIVYWFDKGLIRGYRTPGGHRRIFRSDLEKFMKEHRMPIGHRLSDGHLRVLVVGRDGDLLSACRSSLGSENGTIEWAEARTGFDAGRLVVSFRPDLLVLDLQMKDLDGVSICEGLQADPTTQDIEIVGVGAEDDAPGIERCVKQGTVRLLDPSDTGDLRALVNPGSA
jgi:excisionase family DNA binding protein